MANTTLTIRNIIICLVILSFAGMVVAVVFPYFSARSMMNDVASLKPDNFDDVRLQQWAGKHGGSVSCYGETCYGLSEVTNVVMKNVHLAPPIVFRTGIRMTRNKVIDSLFELSDGRVDGFTTRVVIAYRPSDLFSFPIHNFFISRSPEGQRPTIDYVVTPNSTPAAIGVAYQLRTSCLVRIGGCDQTQQAPAIWELWRSQN